jgi:hypothetical protein
MPDPVHDAPVPLSVLVTDAYLDRAEEVAERLRAAGMRVAAVHGAIGAIDGEAAADRVTALRGVIGVAAVEPRRDFHQPPPESDVQ